MAVLGEAGEAGPGGTRSTEDSKGPVSGQRATRGKWQVGTRGE